MSKRVLVQKQTRPQIENFEKAAIVAHAYSHGTLSAAKTYDVSETAVKKWAANLGFTVKRIVSSQDAASKQYILNPPPSSTLYQNSPEEYSVVMSLIEEGNDLEDVSGLTSYSAQSLRNWYRQEVLAGRRSLTKAQVAKPRVTGANDIKIFNRILNGEKISKLAQEYGVTYGFLYVRYRSWAEKTGNTPYSQLRRRKKARAIKVNKENQNDVVDLTEVLGKMTDILSKLDKRVSHLEA